MKTFADVKRRFAKDVVLECVENAARPELNGGLRRIIKVQTNALCFELLGDNPDAVRTRGKGFWLYFPPAKGVRIVDEDTFDVALRSKGGPIQDGEPYVRLRFMAMCPECEEGTMTVDDHVRVCNKCGYETSGEAGNGERSN